MDRFLKMLSLGLPTGAATPLADRYVQFLLFKNSGIAFSLNLSGPIVWLTSVIILAAVVVMATRDFKAGRSDRSLAYALFVFGACSNLFDRVVYSFTVDYLLFFERSAVNLADGMIVAGAVLLFFTETRRSA